MKILLLNPPTYNNRAFIREGRCNQEQGVWTTLWPPITLATTGAMLEENGHEVEILDCAAQGMPVEELLRIIRHRDYALVTLSMATPSIKSDLALANEIKKISPNIRTAAIGTHVTALAEACFKQTKGLDFIIRNEPEESICDLADCLENEGALKSILGISYRDRDGNAFHNPDRPFIQNLDRLPFPAWHLLDLERYKLPLIGEKFLILSPVRGCPYPCIFCTAQTYYGNRLRKRSVSMIMDEIAYNIHRFEINQFFIWADTFTADRKYVLEFCKRICDKGLKIHWTCNSRVDTVDQVLLETMADSGCWMISYGMEAGNQKVLDRAKKKISIRQSREAVEMARRAGIKVAGHFILGLPGESEETLKETIDFALTLELEIAQFYCAVPFPGSPLYDLAISKGWIETGDFMNFRQDSAVLDLPGLPPSVVNKYRKKGFRRFYLKPGFIFRMFELIKTAGIGKTIKEGINFIRRIF